jgi:tripartite-type tricarboxylate transporter receptor subunit TctC
LSALKGAAPDGLSFALTPMSMLGIYAHTYKKLPYDPVADFTPVSQAVRFDFGFAVGPMVPASVRTLGDFVTWCKANPKDSNYGSPAAGSVPHFVAELFGRAAGFDFKHVPYRGTQPAIVDMMGGQIAAVSGPVGEFLQHLASGKARLIATSGAARSKFAADVPTYAEQGFATPEVVEGLAQMGLEARSSTPAELAALLKKDSERWAPLIKTIGFTADS